MRTRLSALALCLGDVMSVDCLCFEHRNMFECPVMYHGEPHFPVPAIPLMVDFWHDCVGIVAFNRDHDGETVAGWEPC